MLIDHQRFYLQKLTLYHFDCMVDHTSVPPEQRNLLLQSPEYQYITDAGEVVLENLAIIKGFMARDYYDENAEAFMSQ